MLTHKMSTALKKKNELQDELEDLVNEKNVLARKYNEVIQESK